MAITAMDILSRCRRADADMKRLRERAGMYRDAVGRMTSSLDGVGSRGSGMGDHMANVMGEIDDAERQLAQRQQAYTVELAVACRLLDALPQLEREVLNRYYIRRESLTAVATALRYSYSYIRGCKAEGCRTLRALPHAEVARLLPEWYLREDEKRQR